MPRGQRSACRHSSQFPKVCRCFPCSSNLDCSALVPERLLRPRRQQLVQICARDVGDEPRSTALGRHGQSACRVPFFGADCSLQPCAKRYLVKEGVDVSRGEASFAAEYEANGWRVTEVRLSPTNGDAHPAGEHPRGRLLARRRRQGRRVRGFRRLGRRHGGARGGPLLRRSGFSPSRGVAAARSEFPEELRALEQRERHLLSLFGEAQVECTGHGACDYGAGQCYCANRYFGAACEFTYCPKDCAGHGACDFVTGVCLCETNYLPDAFDGCVLRPLYLASTTCEDAAMDARVDSAGAARRAAVPLVHAGRALGSSAAASTARANLVTRPLQGRVLHDFRRAPTPPPEEHGRAEANADERGA